MLLFEWDEKKADQNKCRHKVSFELAKLAFDDPFQLSDYARTVKGEDRFATLAMVGNVLIFIAHTYRKNESGQEVIRIISARKATRKERREYQRRAGG